jgi:hypothetical protein
MLERTIEDKLRKEYFDLLPEIRRVVWQLEAEIRFRTLDILHSLKDYEQLVVKARIKECESAVETLRNKQEGNIFDPDKPELYTLLNLRDLAGVRILVFPDERLIEVHQILRICDSFKSWTADPIPYAKNLEAPKYYGFCDKASSKIQGEYQIVPMLIGHFWEVEHSAMYKPSGWAKGADNDPDRKALRMEVEQALSRFDAEFEQFVKRNSEPPSTTS